MQDNSIRELRRSARKLIRELGVLKLNMSKTRAPQHWHTLIEISNEPNITIAKLGQLFLMSTSNISRIVKSLMNEGLVIANNGADKREKYLSITPKGQHELHHIDEFSHIKIKGALEFLSESDQHQIIDAMDKYSSALELSRLSRDQVKIHTLSTSRPLRKRIIQFIENIQINEFSIPITKAINAGILKVEDDYYFNHSYNFWYAVDDSGNIIGSIGLKKIDDRNAELKKFFVHERYRGKGVSQKLLQTLVKAASKHQFQTLYLGTVDVLQAAHRFYEKYQFTRIAKKDLPKPFEICPLDNTFFKAKLNDVIATLKSPP